MEAPDVSRYRGVRDDKTTAGDRLVADKKTLQRRDAIDDDMRQLFEIRANGILAFIDCDPEKRSKLRAAIVDAMLWAQTQK